MPDTPELDPLSSEPQTPAVSPEPGVPTRDEINSAILAHSGALTIPLVMPLAVLRRRQKQSAFVRFQARQALAYQTAMLIVALALIASIVAMGMSKLLSPLFLAGCSLATLLVIALIGITAIAIKAIFRIDRGEDYRYPLIGKWLE